jgi:hypothetical protein
LADLASVCCAQTLRQEAENAGLLIGTAVRPSQLSETAYASTLARDFNMVEAEDAMKWWVLRPDAASYDFRQGDEVVRFAQAHRMKIRGHCLVWGCDNPDWLTQGHFTTRQLSRLLLSQSMAWDCRCTYPCRMRTCRQSPLTSLRTSPGLRHLGCRFKSLSLMFPCLWILTASLDLTT